MKSFVVFLLSNILLTSCIKEDITPQKPLSQQPIVTDTIVEDTTLSLAGQTWVIKKVLNTDFDDDLRSDTLIFIDVDDYTFNGYPSKYNLTPTSTTFNLTLYDTPWGNISGNLINYDIVSGTIVSKPFNDILGIYGETKIWMYRL
jgi:hypothetical protein